MTRASDHDPADPVHGPPGSVTRRVEVESDAAWARWLCRDSDDRRIVRLDRVIVAEDYNFLSFFYIDAMRFPHFADAPLEIPEAAVVVPGTRAIKGGWGAEQQLGLQAPVIVKYRDEKTDLATALEGWLR